MENMDKTKIAFTEAYEIIKHSNKEIQDKISVNFINILEQYRDISYIPNIDYSKSLDEQTIQHEAKIILGIIYRDYLCDIQKKQELIKNEKELLQQIEKEKLEKYSVDNLFKNTKYASNNNITKENTTTEIVEYKKENWLSKIWNKIINIFKK